MRRFFHGTAIILALLLSVAGIGLLLANPADASPWLLLTAVGGMALTADKPDPVKKRRFIANVSIGDKLDLGSLRHLAESEPQAFVGKMQALIDDGKLRMQDIRDIRGLFATLADVEVPVRMELMTGVTREVQASAFALLTGGLMIAGVNDAYDAVPTIGQELVTERDDNKKISSFAAITTLDTNVDRVDEGVDYPEIGAGEQKYTIAHKRNGRRLSISSETIEENDVAGIVDRINALAEIAAEEVEEQTLRRVCDIDGSAASPAEPYVLHFNGSGTSLYTITANSPSAQCPSGTRLTNNALVDYTDLDAARAVLAAMKNSRGKRINIPGSRMRLLVPDALIGVATKIRGSEMVPGVENELNTWGPRGQWQPGLVSSPKLDDLSTSAWYLGDFKKQFVRKWKLRFEYVTLSGLTEAFLKRRTAFQARIGWDCEVGAVDHVFVVQSLAGTTAPSA